MQAILVAIALCACATLPPPTAELAAAQAAVVRAGDVDADQYAAAELGNARDALARAQAAMAAGDEKRARKLALAAAATADLAHARSQAARVASEHAQRRAEIADLRQRLQVDADVADSTPPVQPAAPPVAEPGAATAGALVQRLAALDADPQLQALAAYERLRARQALDVLLAAGSRDRDDALYVAAQRVGTAELAARTEAMQRQVDRLELARSELLVEASRQEAARARQEAERLRVQAQIQAEEAMRLRQAAEAETAARVEAEGVIEDVAGEQTARLRAARAREAELARQEAELLRAAEEQEATQDDDDRR